MSDLQIIDAPPPKSVVDAPVLAPGDSPLAHQNTEDSDQPEQKPEQKPEPTDAEKELAALKKQLAKAEKRRDAIWAQRQEAKEEARALKQRLGLTGDAIEDTNSTEAEDSDKLSLSRAELQRMIEREAKRLAPTIKEQADAVEQRRTVARALQEELGPDKFQELTDDLADVLPQEAQLLVLETESPRALIEYLTDPEHEAETKAIARLTPAQQGMRIGLLAAQLKAKRSRDKPQPSGAPQPIEPVKSQGDAGVKPLALLSDDEFAKRRKLQIAARR
jgi:hypothetical protein